MIWRRWQTDTTPLQITGPSLLALARWMGQGIALSGKTFRRAGLRAMLLGMLAWLAGSSFLHSQALPGASAMLPPSGYLIPALPSHVLGLLSVYGDRLYKPGNERVTLTGVFNDSSGTSNSTLISEISGKVRISVAGNQPKSLLFDGTQSTANGVPAAGTDQDVLESLQSDTPEAFFYSFQRGAGVRYLGARFRTDNGKNPTYNGPFYDIYQLVQPISVRSGSPMQQKLYFFDSLTGLFAKAHYLIQRGGQTVVVETVFSNWTKATGGQALPGRIERFENGSSVFSFTTAASQVSRATNDGVFPTP